MMILTSLSCQFSKLPRGSGNRVPIWSWGIKSLHRDFTTNGIPTTRCIRRINCQSQRINIIDWINCNVAVHILHVGHARWVSSEPTGGVGLMNSERGKIQTRIFVRGVAGETKRALGVANAEIGIAERRKPGCSLSVLAFIDFQSR